MWPKFAAMFGLPDAEPRHISLTEFMADKGPVWDRIVAKHNLQPYAYSDIVSWGFADALFGLGLGYCAVDTEGTTARLRPVHRDRSHVRGAVR